MERMLFITPINCKQIKNLSITEYFIIYLDKNNKLKRAIPDFDEKIVSKEDSLIDEVFDAERCGFFKTLTKKKYVKTNQPKFIVCIDEEGTVNKYAEENVQLEKLLIDKKTRQNVAKLLKKRR